jgi:hypothetical protein
VGEDNKSYNICSEVGKAPTNCKGYVCSNKAKENYVKAQKKNWEDPKYKEKLSKSISKSLTGKPLSEQHKAKCRTANLGKTQSVEQVLKKSNKWWIKTPEGIELCTIGLQTFCKENNLNHSGMRNVNYELNAHYKNWKCKKIEY